MTLAFLRGLEKAPTFLVPIINPPFADNSPHFPSPGSCYKKYLIPEREGFVRGADSDRLAVCPRSGRSKAGGQSV